MCLFLSVIGPLTDRKFLTGRIYYAIAFTWHPHPLSLSFLFSDPIIANPDRGEKKEKKKKMADPSTSPPLTRASVAEARELIRPFVHRTPVLTSSSLSALASTPTPTQGEGKARPKLRLWFKCENLQKVGAFKARGAFHAIERLKKEPGWLAGGGAERGVVTHSSGW